jgi:hypothetical protein
MLLACAGDGAAGAALPTMSRTDQRLSPTEVSALHGGASNHPYATLALLYLLRDTATAAQDGSLYLQGIPESALSSLLQGSADRDAISTLLGELMWSPYSDTKFFVQVSWSVRPMASSAEVIEFRTQLLLLEGGAFHHPPLEAETTVLLKDGSVSFLSPAAQL